MATLAVTNPTLLEVAKATDPDGKLAQVVEIMNQNNEVLDSMPWMEGNLPTGHRTSIRTGLPAPTWRKMYGGVQPGKSRYAQVTDNCGMLEAYAEIDKALADLNGNTAGFRLLEDKAHIEGMSQEVAQTLFYGNEGTEPEAFTGLLPRFNSLSAENGENIIVGDASASGNDYTSVWLVVWGPASAHGIYPKGSKGGLSVSDLGRVTIENVDGANGRMEGYRTHYKWDCGFSLRDWRYVVRIANIDMSRMTALTSTSGTNLIDAMTQALELPPSLSAGTPAFYCSRRVRSFLRRQITNATVNSTLSMDTVAGRRVVTFGDVPVYRTDALIHTESAVGA